MRIINCNPVINHRRRRGAALISALFITAIAAILATALAMQQQLIIRQGELIIKSDQVYLNLQEAQAVASNLVRNYAMQFIAAAPNAQVLPLRILLPVTKRGSMIYSGTIDNEQGKFNLNDLVYTINQPRFVTLLTALIPGVSPQQADTIAQSITAWMMNGSQDRYYLQLNPPYRSSQSEFSNISELRLIAGVTPQIYAALQPYVTAIPIQKPMLATQLPQSGQPSASTTATPIDINAVSAPVLMTMAPMTMTQAKEIVACRNQAHAFHDLTTFMTQCVKPAGMTTLNNAATISHYYFSSVAMQQAKRTTALNSFLVTQLQKNNTLKVFVMWQAYL